MTTQPTPEAFAAQAKADGFEAPVRVVRDPGYDLGDHSHPFHARALIVEGAITLVVAGQATTYRPGEIFHLPAGTPHEERAEGGVRYLSARKPV